VLAALAAADFRIFGETNMIRRPFTTSHMTARSAAVDGRSNPPRGFGDSSENLTPPTRSELDATIKRRVSDRHLKWQARCKLRMTWAFMVRNSSIRPSRIVSLVPSWTETLFALGFNSEVVGGHEFCVEPVAAVAFHSKSRRHQESGYAAIVKLEPELVIANAEENAAGRRAPAHGGYPGFHDLFRERCRVQSNRSAIGPRAQSRAAGCRLAQGDHAERQWNRGFARSNGASCGCAFSADFGRGLDVFQRRHLCA